MSGVGFKGSADKAFKEMQRTEKREIDADVKLLESVARAFKGDRYKHSTLECNINFAKRRTSLWQFYISMASSSCLGSLYNCVQLERNEERIKKVILEVHKRTKEKFTEAQLYNEVRQIYLDYGCRCGYPTLIDWDSMGRMPKMNESAGLKLSDVFTD